VKSKGAVSQSFGSSSSSRSLLEFLFGRALGVLETTPYGVTYFGAVALDYAHWLTGVLAGMSLYYLMWKYVVNALNEILGIA
jgi:hypothetical protein